MLKIGKSYIARVEGMSRLCADLTIGERRATLWFGVDSAHEEWLVLGRADAFVMALLPGAMRDRHEIRCEDPMSERLYCQLTGGLMPALAFAGDFYHTVRIEAPLTAEPVKNQGAVGTGFSGGVDCLYTIMRHGADSEFPLTHIVVVNREAEWWEKRDTFQKICRRAELFGKEQNLQTVFVDSNYRKIVPDASINLETFRYLSCGMALQGLFKAYLMSSGPNASKLELDVRKVSRYELLTVNHASTESLSFYLSGAETTRAGKLSALAQWEPSHRWLNPCLFVEGELPNCGRCKKCIHDMTMLYAMGQLEQYQAVFDTADYLSHLPSWIGYIVANRDNSESCAQAARLLEENSIPIPAATRIFEKQFRLVKQRSAEISSRRDS